VRASGWREVPFVGGRLDGQTRMVTVGELDRLPEQIRNELPSTPLVEVYELQADDITAGGDRWFYRQPRYVLRDGRDAGEQTGAAVDGVWP
jgi:hypothetical protein